MSSSILIVNDIFSSKNIKEYIPISGFQKGYFESNFSLVLEQAQRTKSVLQNQILDYIQVENDPNFSRSSKLQDFEKYLSNISLITQKLIITNSLVTMMKTKEFLPSNINSLLINYENLIASNMNVLEYIKQFTSFNQIKEVFFQDLLQQFDNGFITFNQILQMKDGIKNILDITKNISNVSIKDIFNITLFQFFNGNILDVFSSNSFLNLIDDIFGDDEEGATEFIISVQNEYINYSEQLIKDVITVSYYENVTISLDDTLGLNLQSQFRNEIENSFNTIMINAVNNSNIPDTNKETMINFFANDIVRVVDIGFKKTITLPNLSQSVSGVVAETNNNTIEYIIASFDKFGSEILTRVGANQPTDINIAPIDHLQNLKRNLHKRIEMFKTGATSDNFIEIENYLRSVLVDQDISQSKLEEYYEYLEETLK